MKYSDILSASELDTHRDMQEEIMFFRQAGSGDIPAIQKNLRDRRFRDSTGVGILSSDPVLNIKYHMVITAGILTRVCISNGMEPEKAFRMSDYYIRKLDGAVSEDDVEIIHGHMVLDFTKSMKDIQQKKALSRPISLSVDYIYSHLSERIRIKELAEHAGVSASFLSRQFSKELGISVSDYIREKKIKMSMDMLLHSNMSILDIAHRLSFSSQSHFIQAFKSVVGVTPKKYRDENGLYDILSTSLK